MDIPTMTFDPETALTLRERRIGVRMESRGEREFFDLLLRLRGTQLNEHRHLGNLFAIGGEGALFELHDAQAPDTRLLGKIALLAWHKPIRLSSKVLRRRRAAIVQESEILTSCGSPYLPACRGLEQFENPFSEKARGAAFAEPEPCLVMERLPGQDMDTWLCRVHRSHLEWMNLRITLSRIAAELLHALADLEERGFLYADLRPGNLRVVGRPERRVRILDAGGCVRIGDTEAPFPHVPSYLPVEHFWAASKGAVVRPSSAIQGVMAGRTLYEIATGDAPKAGSEIDPARLRQGCITSDVAEVVLGLAHGDFLNCADALGQLS